MLQYIPFKDYKGGKHLYRLWNREYKRSYPISSTLFKERILDDANFDKENSYVALYERMPIGFILIKRWMNEELFYSETKTATISLFFVQKDVRNMGIGKELLNLAMQGLKEYPYIEKVQLGHDLSNLLSGLPSDLNKYAPFFMNQNFKQEEGYVDMIQIVKKDTSQQTVYETPKKIHFRIATEEDKEVILKLCLDNDLLRQTYILKKYFESGGSGRRVVLAYVDDKLIGFVRIYDSKHSSIKVNFFLDKSVGSIGVMAIDKEYLSDNYPERITQEAIHYVMMRGSKKIMIEQTKDVEFYKKLGFKAFKYYMRFVKYLNKEEQN